MKKIIAIVVSSASGALLLYNVVTNTNFNSTTDAVVKTKTTPATSFTNVTSIADATVKSKENNVSSISRTRFIEKSYVVSRHRVKLNNEKEVVKSNENTGGIWSSDVQNNNYSTTNEWVLTENLTILPENSDPPPPGPPPPGGSLPINGSVIYLFLIALLLGFFVNYRYSFK